MKLYVAFALLGVSNSDYGLETYETNILTCGGIANSFFSIHKILCPEF